MELEDPSRLPLISPLNVSFPNEKTHLTSDRVVHVIEQSDISDSPFPKAAGQKRSTKMAIFSISDPAKVVFTPTPQYIPKGLNGVIRCEVEANPPITYITWRKDNRLFQPFKTAGMVALKNGSILIDMVTYEHAGDYQCQPFNKRGSAGLSAVIQVQIRDPPTLMKRPESEYVRNVGGTVSFSCQAMGTPTPKITWRRVIFLLCLSEIMSIIKFL
jgi:hypothetical protein